MDRVFKFYPFRILNKRLFLITILLAIFTLTHAHNIDSLQLELKLAKIDSTLIKIQLEIGEEFESTDTDSAIFYYIKALGIAKKNKLNRFIVKSLSRLKVIFYNKCLYNEALDYEYQILAIFTEENDAKALVAENRAIAWMHYQNGDYYKAIDHANIALKINTFSDSIYVQKNIYTTLGTAYLSLGDYPQAIRYYLNVIELDKKTNDSMNLAQAYTNIGWVYGELKDYKKALNYFKESFLLAEKTNNSYTLDFALYGLGVTYSDLEDYVSSDEYYKKGLKSALETKNILSINNYYIALCDLKIKQKKYAEALKYNEMALPFLVQTQDQEGIAIYYQNRVEIFLGQKKYKEAIESSISSFQYIEKTQSIRLYKDGCKFRSTAYDSLGDYRQALKYYKLYTQANDSVINIEKSKQITQMEAKYQAGQKQLEIDKMQTQKELDDKTIEAQNAINRKQQIIIFSVIFGLILFLGFSIFILHLFRQKRKANMLLSLQNAEITLQKEEIFAQRDEIEAQRDMVVQQNEQIQIQKKEITDSIVYAKHIQQAILPTNNYAESVIGEHFILFKPKNVVSGDFYWIKQIKEWLIITVADCTGHGVPGAFMSMLGVSFLNEIVQKQEITKANEILENLRKSVIEALQQKGSVDEQRDGMNMALIVINTLTSHLQYSGAFNPLFIVNTSNEIIEIEADKQPISIYVKMQPFTNREIQLNKGDCIYLTSDGFVDQFGGESHRKFSKKRLKDLFVTIAEKPMTEQKEILETTFEKWRGDTEQIDDVNIVGLRF